MDANLAALLYLAAGVLFILALRGLSSPASSRQGNMFGMIGMTIAMLTTLACSEIRASDLDPDPARSRRGRVRRCQDGA